VLSLLACEGWVPADAEGCFGTGGMYVYPRDGAKIGREDAIERNFVRDVKADS
jgi:hypothetical protein